MILQGLNLYADNGKWLYQGDGASRNFWSSITLAKEENAKYFKECTDEEYLAWKEAYQPEPEPLPEESQEAVEQ
jgi:hypothetical protein